MKAFNEHQFKARVSSAVEKVRTILDNTRNPELPADVSHEYTDKYLLTEFLANSAISAQLNCLEALGMDAEKLKKMKEWSKTRSVTLRLNVEEKCAFIKKTEREVESDTKHVSTGILGKRENYTVTKVTEWFWNFDVKWELIAFYGTEVGNANYTTVLSGRSGKLELKTLVETTPRPSSVVRNPIDVTVTWLFQNIEETGRPSFHVDRKNKKCRTPRRNPEVEAALAHFTRFYHWATSVHSYFSNTLFPVHQNHGLDLSAIQDNTVFVPVLPLFENKNNDATSVIPSVYTNSFLGEQSRTIAEKTKQLSAVFTASDKIITLLEATTLVVLLHSKRIGEAFSEGVDYIEHMLYTQIVVAIGKEVTPIDFTNYLAFHNRKLYNSKYQPRLFSYAIRRPDHYPEGTLTIEAQLDDGTLANPINTLVAHSVAKAPMYFPINAATKVAFLGDRYLHGWVSHSFAGYSGLNLSMIARSRQFSSFILLAGRIVSADTFEPKIGIIIQNRDELKIPLLLETIPTPKQFKDAIESLSPEQQRFCKAFRGMQLESTLFGVCVIQIKPQLEKLLKLDDDSLTKEIQLTQDLLTLFIKYQIPSDLLSYDGPADAEVAQKLARVKGLVANMQTMIDASRQTQIKEAQEAQEFRRAQERHDSYGGPTVLMQQNVHMMSLPTSSASSSGTRLQSLSRSVRESRPSPSGGAPPPPPPSASGPPPPPPSSGPPPPAPVPVSAPAPPPPTPTPTPQPDANSNAPKEIVKIEDQATQVGFPEAGIVDYTQVPAQMEKRFEQFDQDNALHATIINLGDTWTKKSYKSLLSEQATSVLHKTEQHTERDRAFDLLDALTKSGGLVVDQAELHVVVAATHEFDKTIMNTIVQENVNPIDKIENSSLIVATTIHQTAVDALLAPGDHATRIRANNPLLLGSN